MTRSATAANKSSSNAGLIAGIVLIVVAVAIAIMAARSCRL